MDIVTHTNGNFSVDSITVDGKFYFRGVHAAYALGYKNPRKAIRDHCNQKGVINISTDTIKGAQHVKYISEGNLYRLISRSRLESSIEFEEWIYEEVLPSIRKTGMYAIDEIIDNPELAIKALGALMEERNKTKMLEKEREVFVNKIEMDAPKIEFYDVITGSEDTVYMSGVAKVLGVKGMGRNNLFQYLRDKKVLRYNNEPYQSYVDRRYFEVVERNYTVHGEDKIGLTTKVSPKGQEYILKLLREDGYDSRDKTP